MPTCREKIRGEQRCALRIRHVGNHRGLDAIERRNRVRREQRAAE
jgi:hypothetical protein